MRGLQGRRSKAGRGRVDRVQKQLSLLMLGLFSWAWAAVPQVVSERQAKADFFDYVSTEASVGDLKVHHGGDVGAGDPLAFTFTAGRGFQPQAVKGSVTPRQAPAHRGAFCAVTRSGTDFRRARLVRMESRVVMNRTSLRLTYQSGVHYCVYVSEASAFQLTPTRLPASFTQYVYAQPAQIRSLAILGSDFQETNLTLTFTSQGRVKFPSGPSLVQASRADAKRVAQRSECAVLASRADELTLVTAPGATSVGRLVVRGASPDGRHDYCVSVWNTDF